MGPGCGVKVSAGVLKTSLIIFALQLAVDQFPLLGTHWVRNPRSRLHAMAICNCASRNCDPFQMEDTELEQVREGLPVLFAANLRALSRHVS